MVDFMTVVKGSFRKFQLQAEVALLERDASNRQRAFGVELYDLIEEQRRASDAEIRETLRQNNVEDTPEARESADGFLRIFQAVENEIREPLDRCRNDVSSLKGKGFPPLFVQRRKEDFGIEVWSTVSEPKWLHESLDRDLKTAMAADQTQRKDRGAATDSPDEAKKKDAAANLVAGALNAVVKGTVTTINKAIGKLSTEERAVDALVKAAKKDVAVFEDKKLEKLMEIEVLVADNRTLECCA
eukprot:CAMPEP_0197185518 /NCGR_PEP_ID=MMETSP1423-20130617/12108_1 /TAXON_ID=476441 /ORGANISM="Pseudo-nitzschia heimii, Strain UNC1101" /LENGTH=242 /DNA_ID=CAMNT_0042636605 /DNA_START=229 /DNA_END=957 /DNA_ORIENTATION=-